MVGVSYIHKRSYQKYVRQLHDPHLMMVPYQHHSLQTTVTILRSLKESIIKIYTSDLY